MTETPTDWQNVAAAFNSQLAAEREVGHNQAVTLGQQIARLEDQLAAERENGHWLGELLAVIHCDGGQYQSEHGTKKATADAIKKRNEMVMRIDELETQLAAERDERRLRIAQLVEAEKQWKDWQFLATDLKDALAAEREQVQGLQETLGRSGRDRSALAQQLTAERQKLRELQQANDNLFKVARKHSVENTKLRRAFDDAVAANKTYREHEKYPR